MSSEIKKRSTSEHGLGLVQALVAVAIVAIISLTIATLMANMQKSQNGTKFRIDGDNLNEEIRALLSKPAACTQTFGGLIANAGASFTIGAIKDAAGTAKYSPGSRYGDFSLLLSSLTFDDFVAGTDVNKAQMTLRSYLQTAKEASGAQVIYRKILISLELDSTNKITSCIALTEMNDGIWQRSAANLNNIFFVGPPTVLPPAPPLPGGNVGIGRSDPQLWAVEIERQNYWPVVSSWAFRNTPGPLQAPHFIGLAARGTSLAPSYLLNNDFVACFDGRNAMNPGVPSGGSGMCVSASQNLHISDVFF